MERASSIKLKPEIILKKQNVFPSSDPDPIRFRLAAHTFLLPEWAEGSYLIQIIMYKIKVHFGNRLKYAAVLSLYGTSYLSVLENIDRLGGNKNGNLYDIPVCWKEL